MNTRNEFKHFSASPGPFLTYLVVVYDDQHNSQLQGFKLVRETLAFRLSRFRERMKFVRIPMPVKKHSLI